MGIVDPLINIEDATRVFSGNDAQKKASYAAMIGRTMIGVREKSKENLRQIMKILIEYVIVEKDDFAKEEMYTALLYIVTLNDLEYVKDEVESLVTKLELLKDKDLAEAIYVISETYEARYIKLFEKYIAYPYDEVQDAAKEAIHDIKYAEKMKREKNK